MPIRLLYCIYRHVRGHSVLICLTQLRLSFGLKGHPDAQVRPDCRFGSHRTISAQQVHPGSRLEGR